MYFFAFSSWITPQKPKEGKEKKNFRFTKKYTYFVPSLYANVNIIDQGRSVQQRANSWRNEEGNGGRVNRKTRSRYLKRIKRNKRHSGQAYFPSSSLSLQSRLSFSRSLTFLSAAFSALSRFPCLFLVDVSHSVWSNSLLPSRVNFFLEFFRESSWKSKS